MKIAFISQPLDRVAPPSMNSIGIWIYETSRRLAKNNAVAVYARKGISAPNAIGQEVNTHYILSMPGRWMTRIARRVSPFSRPKKPFFSSVFYNIEYSLQIAASLMWQKADFVHIQNYSQFVPIIRAFNPKVKIALHMRCEWLTQLDHRMIASRLKKTDLIFGVSDYITNKIREEFPEHNDKCFTIANGVDVEEFQAQTDRPDASNPPRTILMVGRISPEKGIHVLLEAFEKVARRFPDVQLELVGPIASVNKEYIVELSEEAQVSSLEVFYQGRYWNQLQELIPDDLKERIHFRGSVKYYATIGHYQNATILVNPSLSEAFGRSLIEANACEVPVIAARTGGMTEIIDPGYNGLLVEPGNAAELAQAMIWLLENEPLRRQMGRNGRERVLERYTWDKICADLLNVYRCDLSKEKGLDRGR